MSKLNIRDIADLVGVSTATISNYLNGNYSKMSEKTKTKIENMIRETNYVPSTVARGLATNESKVIGVSVADITNPFTSTLLSGIYEACEEFGYSVTFTNADGDAEKEIENLTRLRHQDVAGLIIDSVDVESLILKMLGNEKTILVDRQSDNITIDTVATDNRESVYDFITDMKKNMMIFTLLVGLWKM